MTRLLMQRPALGCHSYPFLRTGHGSFRALAPTLMQRPPVRAARAEIAAFRKAPLTGAAASVTFAPVMSAIVMITTVGNEEQANLIARELVLRRNAACVNIMSGVRSVYRWKGKICRDAEYVLMIKTLLTEYEAVSETIRELHDYELPEILAFEILQGDQSFLDWIAHSLDKEAEFGDEDDLPNPESL